jgi:transaldolase
VIHIGALAAPDTVNAGPEETLFGDVDRPERWDGDDSEQVLTSIARAGIDVAALVRELQDEGANSFVDSWKDLLSANEAKSRALS